MYGNRKVNLMINVRYIHSIDEITELLFERVQGIDGRHRSSFFYRGMPDKDFDLSTSLSRNCKEMSDVMELPMLENFIKYVSIIDPTINESIWKAMIVGQHHGLPTRLVDWTHSALVALHFSVTEVNLDDLSSRDSVVWRIDAKELNRKLPEKYRNALEQKKTLTFSLQMLTDVTGSVEEYDRDMGQESLVMIEPPSIDQRIVTQYSFFTMLPKGVNDLEEFLNQHTENTVKYVIDRSIRWELRDILDQLNLNERTIYPGIDGIAKWLARQYYSL